MRTHRPRSKHSHSRGVSLIECLVYLSVFTLLLGVALMAFYRCMDNMKRMRSNADDIARTLHAGEQWRSDVRTATSTIEFEEGGNTMRLRQPQGEVVYKLEGTQLMRKSVADSRWIVLLPKVQRSQMQKEARAYVTVIRWELELQSSRKPPHLHPTFSFLAVNGDGKRP